MIFIDFITQLFSSFTLHISIRRLVLDFFFRAFVMMKNVLCIFRVDLITHNLFCNCKLYHFRPNRDLASNELTEIQKGGLLNLTALTKLSLANNSIESIGSSCWEFSQKIQHLDLAGNRLANLSVNTFEHLSKLKQLDLRHNAIATIAGGTFNTTPNLHTLDLGHNQISWTIEDMHGPFAPLKLLDRLNLNDNEIKSVNQHAFAGLKALTWLDLTNNNLTSVQFNAFETKTTPQLKHLQINSNDLICDCNMLWFFTWLRKVSGIRRAQAVTMNYGGEGAAKRFGNGDKNDARCAYPATLRGKRLLELHKNNLTCSKKRLLCYSSIYFILFFSILSLFSAWHRCSLQKIENANAMARGADNDIYLSI